MSQLFVLALLVLVEERHGLSELAVKVLIAAALWISPKRIYL